MNPIRFTASTYWSESMKELDDSLRLEIYDAIFEYVATRKVPKLSKVAKVAFLFIKGDLDTNLKKGDMLREARKAAGSKGGLKRSINLKVYNQNETNN